MLRSGYVSGYNSWCQGEQTETHIPLTVNSESRKQGLFNYQWLFCCLCPISSFLWFISAYGASENDVSNNDPLSKSCFSMHF